MMKFLVDRPQLISQLIYFWISLIGLMAMSTILVRRFSWPTNQFFRPQIQLLEGDLAAALWNANRINLEIQPSK